MAKLEEDLREVNYGLKHYGNRITALEKENELLKKKLIDIGHVTSE